MENPANVNGQVNYELNKRGGVFGLVISLLIAIVNIVSLPFFVIIISLLFGGLLRLVQNVFILFLVYMSPFLFLNTVAFFISKDKSHKRCLLFGYLWVVPAILISFIGVAISFTV